MESISVSYAGITRIRFMGFEIYVYLISAGPTQLPVFNCSLRILLRVSRVNRKFRWERFNEPSFLSDMLFFLRGKFAFFF